MLQCLECGVDLGVKSHWRSKVSELELCEGCFDQTLGRVVSLMDEDERKHYGEWVESDEEVAS